MDDPKTHMINGLTYTRCPWFMDVFAGTYLVFMELYQLVECGLLEMSETIPFTTYDGRV